MVPGATLSGLPAGALYRVRATYRYTREDTDELSFDVGDVIRVVEYDDPEEQVHPSNDDFADTLLSYPCRYIYINQYEHNGETTR